MAAETTKTIPVSRECANNAALLIFLCEPKTSMSYPVWMSLILKVCQQQQDTSE